MILRQFAQQENSTKLKHPIKLNLMSYSLINKIYSGPFSSYAHQNRDGNETIYIGAMC